MLVFCVVREPWTNLTHNFIKTPEMCTKFDVNITCITISMHSSNKEFNDSMCFLGNTPNKVDVIRFDNIIISDKKLKLLEVALISPFCTARTLYLNLYKYNNYTGIFETIAAGMTRLRWLFLNIYDKSTQFARSMCLLASSLRCTLRGMLLVVPEPDVMSSVYQAALKPSCKLLSFSGVLLNSVASYQSISLELTTNLQRRALLVAMMTSHYPKHGARSAISVLPRELFCELTDMLFGPGSRFVSQITRHE